MIWNKGSFTDVGSLQTRYGQVFEYMFVFSKGKPKTFNALKDRKNICAGKKSTGKLRKKDGTMINRPTYGNIESEYGIRFNIWSITCEKHSSQVGHPAMFPIQLVTDHILTWSNVGDVVFDPFLGSGTTAIAAKNNNRHYIGFEKCDKYYEIAKNRIERETSQHNIFEYITENAKVEK